MSAKIGAKLSTGALVMGTADSWDSPPNPISYTTVSTAAPKIPSANSNSISDLHSPPYANNHSNLQLVVNNPQIMGQDCKRQIGCLG